MSLKNLSCASDFCLLSQFIWQRMCYVHENHFLANNFGNECVFHMIKCQCASPFANICVLSIWLCVIMRIVHSFPLKRCVFFSFIQWTRLQLWIGISVDLTVQHKCWNIRSNRKNVAHKRKDGRWKYGGIFQWDHSFFLCEMPITHGAYWFIAKKLPTLRSVSHEIILIGMVFLSRFCKIYLSWIAMNEIIINIRVDDCRCYKGNSKQRLQTFISTKEFFNNHQFCMSIANFTAVKHTHTHNMDVTHSVRFNVRFWWFCIQIQSNI